MQLWSQEPKHVAFCKLVHSFHPKTVETGPMMIKRLRHFKRYLEVEHGNILSNDEPRLAIVSHAGFIKRFFDMKGAKNAEVYVRPMKLKLPV
jgi:broad specificity phosphatase PhoE